MSIKQEITQAGNVMVELAIVLPLLVILCFWTLELALELNDFNTAVTLSKQTANYVYKECATERDVQMTSCPARILDNLNTILAGNINEIQNGQPEPIHQGMQSHIAFAVYYRSIDGSIRNYYVSSNNPNTDFVNDNGNRCQQQQNFDIDAQTLLNNNPSLSSVVVAQAFVYHKPITGRLCEFWGGQNDCGDGYYICDTTIL